MNHRARTLTLLAVLAVTAGLTLSGCAADTAGTSTVVKKAHSQNADRAWNAGGKVTVPTPKADSGKGVNILFTGFGKDNNLANAYFDAVESEVSSYGGAAEFAGPPTADALAQNKLLCDAATSHRYQAIIVQPIDSAGIVHCAKQAIAAGIPIVSIEFPIGPNITSSSIQTPGVISQIREDVVGLAEAQANATVKECENTNPCRVGIGWGVRSLPFDAAKVKPLLSILAQHKNIKVVCQADASYDEASGQKAAADCLTAHPDVNILVMGSDEAAHGSELAITHAGRTFGDQVDQVKIIGEYARKYGVQQIIDKKWAMSTFARPNADGRAAVDLLLVHKSGKTIPESINDQDLDAIGLTVYPDTVNRVPNIVDLAY